MSNDSVNPRHGIPLNMRRLSWNRIFSPDRRQQLKRDYLLDGSSLPVQMTEPELLASIGNSEVMISGWGGVPLSKFVLDACPKLRLVIHGAGSVKSLFTPEAMRREIRFCSAVRINARPVAEFCLGIILCDLKRVFRFRGIFNRSSNLIDEWWDCHRSFDGGYAGKKIGIVHWGETARALAEMLRAFEFEVLVDSEYLTDQECDGYGVCRSNLETIMSTCDVVTLHAAETPKTMNMIHAGNLGLMKTGSCLINTARGGLIDEEALVNILREGRIWAFLDIARREPPPNGHPFYSLENCILTPHISGSVGQEAFRLGDYVARELDNYFSGKDPEYEVNLSQLAERA